MELTYYHCSSNKNVRNQVVHNAFQNPGIQNIGNHNGLIVVPVIVNQNLNGNGNVVAARAEGNATRNNDRSAELHNYDNCYDNEIFNMFTQEEEYTELLKPIPELHQVQKNNSNVISKESFKKLKVVEVSGSDSTQETPSNDPKEMSEEDVQNMLEIVPVSKFKVEALQKDYPLSNAVMIMMLSAKLQVEEDSEMARDLVMKIFMEANKPKSITPTTVEEVNTKVVELAELYEHDIQDFHALLEDAQDGTLCVVRDMRREMSDMQKELISQQEQQIMVRTRRGQTLPPTNPNNMTPEVVQTMIDQALLRNSGGGDGNHSSHAENPKNMHTARPCNYADFMKCHPLNFKGTEG
nr:hypothetical protein [Tanacetum cinerariifolium]